jgi:diguanylate cyclase (GGDEF)-like protein
VFLFFIVRFIIHRDAVVSAFFWTLVSVFIALAFEKLGPLSPVYFATGGLALVISVIETSYSMAYHDELTGLPGRRSLNEALRKLTSRYAIAMVDIDHFKQFNDRYGHDVGDQVLRMVGSKLVRTTGGARAFRYGGEEFILVFHESLMDVIPHLETLRKTIGRSEFMLRGSRRHRKKPKQPQTTEPPQNGVSVTVSIGLAERDDNYRTPEEVVRAADKALYRAKNSGRNRVST